MSLAKIAGVAKSVCARLLDSLGITVNGAYTPPTGSLLSAVGGLAESLRVYSTSTTVVAVSFGRLLLRDSDGNTAIRENASGTINTASEGLGGLDHTGGALTSTRYYVYAIYNGTSNALIASRYSLRIGGISDPSFPSGYDYYREVGEFYVDSSGDIVGFKRIGDTVTFNDYTDGTIMAAGNFTTTFVEYAYPACAPARAEKVQLTFRASYNSNFTFMTVVADDASGNSARYPQGSGLSGQAFQGFYGSFNAEIVPSVADLSTGPFFRIHGSGSQSLNISYVYMTGYTWRI